jgi:hypothetical protein
MNSRQAVRSSTDTGRGGRIAIRAWTMYAKSKKISTAINIHIAQRNKASLHHENKNRNTRTETKIIGMPITWVTTTFLLDPNTGLPWTGTGVNAALGGVKVAS